MDFRRRQLKENKETSNSTLDFPSNLQFFSPKSGDLERGRRVRQLEERLSNMSQTRQQDSSALISKLECSISQLSLRVTNIERIVPHPHIPRQPEALSPLYQKRRLMTPNKDQSNPRSTFPNLAEKTSEPESKEQLSKVVDLLRTECDGKIKAATDRIMLDFTIKKQFDLKAREEQQRANEANSETKLSEALGKIRIELEHEIMRKFTKLLEDDAEQMAKKIETNMAAVRKRVLEEIEKDRSSCMESIAKARVELEGRLKAKVEREDYNPKRDAETKKKEEEGKARLEETKRKMNEMENRLQMKITAEATKSRNYTSEWVSRVKAIEIKLGELEAAVRSGEESRERKASQIEQCKSSLRQLESEMRGAVEMQSEGYLSNLEQLRQEISGSMLELKGDLKSIAHQLPLSFTHLTTHLQLIQATLSQQLSQTQAATADQTLRLQFTAKWEAFSQSIQQLAAKLSDLAASSKEDRTWTHAQLSAAEELIKRLQAGLFAEREGNQAALKKMGEDILDMANSLTLMLDELKPYHP